MRRSATYESPKVFFIDTSGVYSHPLPVFCYNGAIGLLTVDFECNPAFAAGNTWGAKTFYVTAVPRRRPRTIFDGASDVLTSALSNLSSLLGSDRRGH